MAHVFPTAHIEAARLVSESDALDGAAELVMGSVKAVARQHESTGNYIRNLKITTERTKRGLLDRLVVADDDEAQLIEFGAVVKATGRIIPGLHIMRDGLNRL